MIYIYIYISGLFDAFISLWELFPHSLNKLKPSFSQIVMKPRQKVHMHPWPILIIFCHKFVFTFFEGIISPLILVWNTKLKMTIMVAFCLLILFTSSCIICPVVSVLGLTWFIRYIYYWNLQVLNNVIIIKSKVLLPQT